MTSIEAISEIIKTYSKYGWVLRRLLLMTATRDTLRADDFGVPIVVSVIDAAWFSRPPQNGPVAWEIRYLGDTPFALLEHLNESDADFETALREVEKRLIEKVTERESA